MNDLRPAATISPLRQRLIDDMNMRGFSRETQRNYIRDVGRFATFLGRSGVASEPPVALGSPLRPLRNLLRVARNAPHSPIPRPIPILRQLAFNQPAAPGATDDRTEAIW
jgi:hypothetical protein